MPRSGISEHLQQFRVLHCTFRCTPGVPVYQETLHLAKRKPLVLEEEGIHHDQKSGTLEQEKKERNVLNRGQILTCIEAGTPAAPHRRIPAGVGQTLKAPWLQ